MFEKIGDRNVIIQLMANLYNYQTTQVGNNQIMNLYMDKTGHLGGSAIIENANGML